MIDALVEVVMATQHNAGGHKQYPVSGCLRCQLSHEEQAELNQARRQMQRGELSKHAYQQSVTDVLERRRSAQQAEQAFDLEVARVRREAERRGAPISLAAARQAVTDWQAEETRTSGERERALAAQIVSRGRRRTPGPRKRRRPRAFTRWDLEAAWRACVAAELQGTEFEVAELLRCGDRTIRDRMSRWGTTWPPDWSKLPDSAV